VSEPVGSNQKSEPQQGYEAKREKPELIELSCQREPSSFLNWSPASALRRGRIGRNSLNAMVILMAKEIRTVCDSAGVPILGIVKEDNHLTIYEADDMDRQISVPTSVVPTLIEYLESLR
jgi:hypothetical protein